MARLLDEFETLFECVSEVIRAPEDHSPHPIETRERIEQLIGEARARCDGAGLRADFDAVHCPVVFLIDNLFRQRFGIDHWPELQQGPLCRTATGDHDFWSMLERELALGAGASAERLTVYLACMGMGFRGEYAVQESDNDAAQRGKLHYVLDTVGKIRSRLLAVEPEGPFRSEELDRQICPQSYAHTIERPPIVPPRTALSVAVGLSVLMVVGAVAAYPFIHEWQMRALRGYAKAINP